MGTQPSKAITESDAAHLAHAVDVAIGKRHANQPNATRAGFKHIDLPKAVALRIREKLTHEEIAERLGCGRVAVSQGLKKFLQFVEDPGELAAYRENKSDLLENMEFKLLQFLHSRLKLPMSKTDNVRDIANALKVVYELKRLENNQSTSNVSMFIKSIEEANNGPVVDVKEITNEQSRVEQADAGRAHPHQPHDHEGTTHAPESSRPHPA